MSSMSDHTGPITRARHSNQTSSKSRLASASKRCSKRKKVNVSSQIDENETLLSRKSGELVCSDWIAAAALASAAAKKLLASAEPIATEKDNQATPGFPLMTSSPAPQRDNSPAAFPLNSSLTDTGMCGTLSSDEIDGPKLSSLSLSTDAATERPIRARNGSIAPFVPETECENNMIGDDNVGEIVPRALVVAEPAAAIETVVVDDFLRTLSAGQNKANTEPHLDGVVDSVALTTSFAALGSETVSPTATVTEGTNALQEIPVEDRKVAATTSKSTGFVLTESTQPVVASATPSIQNVELNASLVDSSSSPALMSEPTSHHSTVVTEATDTPTASFYIDAIDAIARAVAIADDDTVAQCFAQDILLRSFGSNEPSLSSASTPDNLSDTSALIHDFLLHIPVDTSNSTATLQHLQTAMYHLLLASGTTTIPAAPATTFRDNDPREAAF